MRIRHVSALKCDQLELSRACRSSIAVILPDLSASTDYTERPHNYWCVSVCDGRHERAEGGLPETIPIILGPDQVRDHHTHHQGDLVNIP